MAYCMEKEFMVNYTADYMFADYHCLTKKMHFFLPRSDSFYHFLHYIYGRVPLVNMHGVPNSCSFTISYSGDVTSYIGAEKAL